MMAEMKRRRFLATSTTATLSLALAGPLRALAPDNRYRRNIGIQLYTLRGLIGRDAAATLQAVADAGYQQAELYGFPNADAMLAGARDAGVAVHSAHFEWDTVVNPKDEKMSDFATILEKAGNEKITHLVIPFLHGHNRRNLDDYRLVADRCNQAAAMAKEAGIQLAYHNHAFEFQPLEGEKSGFDVMIERFSPEMMFEIDVFWVRVAGHDPAGLIKKLDGRVSQLHLKDLKDGLELPDFGSIPQDAFKELGNGIIPMKPILAAAEEAGVAHCHVEQDHSPDAMASIRTSIAHLASL